jgi:hypothetical protein
MAPSSKDGTKGLKAVEGFFYRRNRFGQGFLAGQLYVRFINCETMIEDNLVGNVRWRVALFDREVTDG